MVGDLLAMEEAGTGEEWHRHSFWGPDFETGTRWWINIIKAVYDSRHVS